MQHNTPTSEQLAQTYGAVWHTEHDGDVFCITELMFHVSLLINPHPICGYEDRYCFHNTELAIRAIEEYKSTGELKYWKKHHTKNISVVGRYAYPPGAFHIPKNALYQVDWDEEALAKQYPFNRSIL